MSFIKVATHLYPTERIEKVGLVKIGGRDGVEVKLFGISDTFQYTGEIAEYVWNLLKDFQPAAAPPATTLLLDGKEVIISEIEWVDLEASIDGQTGVEIRTRQDGFDNNHVPLTRQYIKDAASQAYDVLVEALGQE